MTCTLALARREVFNYLLTPTGYIITAVFSLFAALLFFLIGYVYGGGFNQGEPASLSLLFTGGIWVFLFIAPAISMSTLSDEYRLGTIESLMTAPLRESQIILGKFFGALTFLIIMLLPTLLLVGALEVYGRPDYGAVGCGYLGMILAGAAFLATGLLLSTITASQVLAYLATLFFWLILLMTTKGLPVAAALLESRVTSEQQGSAIDGLAEAASGLSSIVAAADPQRIIRDFSTGLVDTFNIAYFLVFTIIPLLGAIGVLQLRRWR